MPLGSYLVVNSIWVKTCSIPWHHGENYQTPLFTGRLVSFWFSIRFSMSTTVSKAKFNIKNERKIPVYAAYCSVFGVLLISWFLKECQLQQITVIKNGKVMTRKTKHCDDSLALAHPFDLLRNASLDTEWRLKVRGAGLVRKGFL